MEQSPRLSLSYVAPSQAQKHVTVNETFRRLDALVQMTVRSRTTSAQPAAPDEGDGYILPAAPTGAAWDNYQADDLAFFQDGAWVSVAGVAGMRAYVADDDALVIFDGAAWSPVGGGTQSALFGVNTAADATNRLAVKSDAVLFSHDDVTPGSGDARVNVNKAAVGDTASHLFQTGFSGRAEFGLVGDDDFTIKVSADGASWKDAITIDKDTGHLGVNKTPTSVFALDVAGGFRFRVSDPATAQECYIFDADTGGATNIFWYRPTVRDFLIGTGAGDFVSRASVLRPDSDNSQPLGAVDKRWSVVYAATGTINTSDERRKMDIRPCDLGLSFVRDLKPIKYRHKDGGNRIVGVDAATDEVVTERREGVRTHYGLSAQQVRSSLRAHKAGDFAGWVLADKDDAKSTQGLRYDQFIPLLIKSIQELADDVDALKRR